MRWGGAGLGLDVERDQQTVGRGGVESDLLVTAGRATFGRGPLQAVESALGRAGSGAESGGPLGDFPGAFAAGSLRAAALGLVLAGLLTTLGVARAGGGGGD